MLNVPSHEGSRCTPKSICDSQFQVQDLGVEEIGNRFAKVCTGILVSGNCFGPLRMQDIFMAVHCCFGLSDALSIFEAKWFLRESTTSRFAVRQACLYLTLMFSSLVTFHRFSNFLRLRLASCASGGTTST